MTNRNIAITNHLHVLVTQTLEFPNPNPIPLSYLHLPKDIFLDFLDHFFRRRVFNRFLDFVFPHLT